MASDILFLELPYDIVKKILSCLNVKERATTSLVLRNWHHMIKSLDDRKFIHKYPTKIYCGYCYCYPYFKVKEFCGKCLLTVIKLAANFNTTEIYLLVPTSSAFFKISAAVTESRSLSVLHLKLCEINENDIKEFPCLKEIRFDQVSISPATFSNLINMCPSIVVLTLKDCSSLNSVLVPDLNQLKKVHVSCVSTYVQTIEIKARNLLEFHLFNSPAELEVDLCACTKLQVLNLNCAYIPQGFPQDVCSTFQCLKSLSLPICKGLNKIKIMSPELESLSLIDLDIVTPNLGLFKLFNSVGSELMEVEIGLKYVRATNRFLEMLPLETETTESKEVISHSGNLRSNVEPLFIKNINLEILMSRVSRYESLIDELFSYFHPRTLLVRVDFDALKYYNFIQEPPLEKPLDYRLYLDSLEADCFCCHCVCFHINSFDFSMKTDG